MESSLSDSVCVSALAGIASFDSGRRLNRAAAFGAHANSSVNRAEPSQLRSRVVIACMH